ncbi:unnamed protein product [Effrenium voratum]|nr:unnamed protein product [Effrenium voratum]
MAISLEYRFTFINVLEEEPSLHLKTRSASVPPRRSPEMCSAMENELEDGRYVQALTQKLSPIFGAEAASPREIPSGEISSVADGEKDTVLPDGMSSLPLSDWRSSIGTSNDQDSESGLSLSASNASNPGSVGHPELCRRPCIYFAAGECKNSEGCNFCHLSHAHRSATLDKNQRQLIKELDKHEFLSVLLRCLQNKAAQGKFQPEAQSVLDLFEARLLKEPVQMGKEEPSKAKMNNLERALGRMTFFSVASLTTRAQFDKEFLDCCKTEVGKLRAHFDQ